MEVLPTDRLVRYFLYATLINFAAAVAFTVPVIVPEFTFPLALTVWPGTWMFEAYFSFLIVGVLGNLGWAAFLDIMKRNTGTETSTRYPAFAHLVISNVAVYGATSLMFTVGFLGGQGALLGYGKAVITQSIIGWMVVPIGVFIYLYAVSSLIGIGNVAWMLTNGKRAAFISNIGAGALRTKDLKFWGLLLGTLSAIFVILPFLEIPFYPNNYLQEVSVQAVAGAVFGIAVVIEGYALFAKSKAISTPVPKGGM
jgi:hypothetical protein